MQSWWRLWVLLGASFLVEGGSFGGFGGGGLGCVTGHRVHPTTVSSVWCELTPASYIACVFWSCLRQCVGGIAFLYQCCTSPLLAFGPFEWLEMA